MQPGSPAALLSEEFIDLLKEIGHIRQWAISAQEMLENMEQSYALTWFLHNTRTLKGHLISAAFCLDPQERPLKDFHFFTDVQAPEQHITVYDLNTRFEEFKERINRLRNAYENSLDTNRPARVFFDAAEQQLKLMEWNIEQIEDAV